ncbi:MAG: Papain-like cysteine protease AvrRpt2 [Pseudomonadota bacterium]|jgi:hypothetical protein
MTIGSPFNQATLGMATSMPSAVNNETIVGFEKWCVPQPKKSNWCWAAVSKAMVGFAKGEDLTLAEIASRVGKALNQSPLMQSDAFDIPTALGVLNVNSSGPLNLLKSDDQKVRNCVLAQTPIAATITWFGPNGTFESMGHAIAIFGWVPLTREVWVFDPNTVGESADIIKRVPIDEMRNYLEGAECNKRGTWGDGYVVTSDAD